MNSKEKIVIVDDEADVRETLEEYLVMQGYAVSAMDGGQALRTAIEAGESFDLALLDITMPGEDGLSLARFLREQGDTGVIMVTASGETVDRIVGLEIGADDYLAKPVDLRELLARVKAVLRRLSASQSSEGSDPAEDANRVVAFGRCRLDLDAHKLLDEDGDELTLTAMEFDLLKAFAERPNRVLTRNQLLELAHDRSLAPFDRSIDIRIARIRRKIERDPGKPQVIKTVRGAGYVFSPGSG